MLIMKSKKNKNFLKITTETWKTGQKREKSEKNAVFLLTICYFLLSIVISSCFFAPFVVLGVPFGCTQSLP
jgi:hypothetical protein